VRGFPIKYYRHIIEKIGAVADKPYTFIFKKLKQVMLSRIIAIEGAE